MDGIDQERYALVWRPKPSDMVSLGLVIAQFDKSGEVIPTMEAAAKAAAVDRNATVVATTAVPGSYDVPLAADRLARRGDIDAVVAIGAIVTGETDHDQVIAHACAHGLTRVSVTRDTPVMLGITGPGMTADQARERTQYGAQAVHSAIDFVEEHQP